MTATPPSADTANEIAIEAYIYLYSLVTMEVSRRQLSHGEPDAQPGRGPMNMFHHIRTFPAADFKVVVRPNFDTLYSSAWIDVAREPVVVTAPASPDRYYLLPCLDMWTDAFAVPGTRTSGPDPIAFALCSPTWSGNLPAGVERIDAPTPTVWMIGRTQTNGPADYAAVAAFQDELTMTPLSAYPGPAPAPVVDDDPSVDTTTPPLDLVNGMAAADYFTLGTSLMAVHPPHVTDWSTLARMRRIGLTPGPLDVSALDATARTALEAAPAAGLAQLADRFPHLAPAVNGWMDITDTMGVYGNHYVKRAIVSMVGLGANPAEDAIYPVLQVDADGQPLDGAHSYVIRFEADALPPAGAFWSVTMYDDQGFQAANELDRFAIGDRDDLTFGDDGSIELYLVHQNPGPEKVANWLPAPLGALGVTMRLYEPLPAALSGAWVPPPVRRVD